VKSGVAPAPTLKMAYSMDGLNWHETDTFISDKVGFFVGHFKQTDSLTIGGTLFHWEEYSY
jgi:hypothetical protein